MVETYTVQSAMKTGNKSDKYGEEYYVKFVESEQTFTLWFKKDPSGEKLEGSIEGSKFVKAKKEYTPGAPQTGGQPPRKSGYDGDGQKQGMAINNAAEYVNDHAPELVDPETWAITVIKYAKALYKRSDLNAEEVLTEAATAGELFKNVR